jgi:adenylylsulfate kinase
MIIQLCGLSGSGKTTIANKTKELLTISGITTEIIDGDEYRKELCADLGFSREDRNKNIRRLAFVAGKLSEHHILSIICAINPYDNVRQEVAAKYKHVKTVFIDCDMNTLITRDTKGFYKRSQLPDGDPGKMNNLTGVNDPFEPPTKADLVIHTNLEQADQSADKLHHFILKYWDEFIS